MHLSVITAILLAKKRQKVDFIISSKLSCKFLVGCHIIAFLIFCKLRLFIYKVLLAGFVVVVVHRRQVWLVVCIHASWKESQHTVSYLVCHRVWIEEFASYLDREVWRGTLPTATNTTLSKVHGAAKNHASCKIVCQANFVKISERGGRKVRKTVRVVWEQTMTKRSVIWMLGERRQWNLWLWSPRQ